MDARGIRADRGWCWTTGIKKCTVNNRTVSQTRHDEPYSNFKIHDTATIHQHHMFRKKIEGVLHDPPEHELIITLPTKFRIEPAVSRKCAGP